jgi:hypothetical protein
VTVLASASFTPLPQFSASHRAARSKAGVVPKAISPGPLPSMISCTMPLGVVAAQPQMQPLPPNSAMAPYPMVPHSLPTPL